jgi:acyl carrier protein phosphodiesterase
VNFLAHFHLAWPDRGLLAGGLEGEYYKGPLRGDLPRPIERGVLLHRAIDAYTDQHALIVQLRREFPRALRRYAGILIDLSFDHCLSRHWPRFSNIPMREFNAAVYRSLRAQQADLSESSRAMLARLQQYDILARYTDWEAVPASAARVGLRLRRGNPLAATERELAGLRGTLEEVFLAFYPELQAFSAEQRARLTVAPGAKTP